MIRRPVARVLANAVPAPGLVSVELHASGAFQADRFAAEFALRADPVFGLDWWEAQRDATLEIGFGLDGGAVAPMLVGRIDRLEVDPFAGLVSVSGRDLSAALIDAPAGDSFVNRTANEIAVILAARHGLACVTGPDAGLAGRTYRSDHDQLGLGRLARSRSEWDLLAELAQGGACELYVQNRTLYFAPPPSAPPFEVFWDAATGRGNVSALRLSLLPAAARGAQIRVRCWHSRQGVGFDGVAGAAGGLAGTLLRPNLSQDAAQALAERLQVELASQARQVEIRMPGELSLDPRGTLRLAGDLGGWAGDYRITTITRRLDAESGFTQSVTARRAAA